jgi:hypothetical protein
MNCEVWAKDRCGHFKALYQNVALENYWNISAHAAAFVWQLNPENLDYEAGLTTQLCGLQQTPLKLLFIKPYSTLRRMKDDCKTRFLFTLQYRSNLLQFRLKVNFPAIIWKSSSWTCKDSWTMIQLMVTYWQREYEFHVWWAGVPTRKYPLSLLIFNNYRPDRYNVVT